LVTLWINIMSIEKIKKTSLKFLGHNCFLIENENEFLVIDPWLSKKGASFGNWFQYPKNWHLQEYVINLTNTKKGFIYYTHEHQDHFDIDTLLKFNKSVQVLIPSFNDKYLKNKIEELGFNVWEIAEDVKKNLSNRISVNVYISDTGIDHDSAILVKTSDFNFFNQNDCKIFDRLNEIKDNITFYSVQFSGAIWHPVCYSNLTENEKSTISKKKIEIKLSQIDRAVKILNPKFTLPCAGPTVFPFLDEKLSFGSTETIFIHQPVVDQYLKERGHQNLMYPMPGDIVDETTSKCAIEPPSKSYFESYKNEVEDQWSKINTDSFSKEKLIQKLEKRLDLIWDIPFQDTPIIIFSWGDQEQDKVYIDLESKMILNNLNFLPDKFFKISADKQFFSLLCNDERWQDVYLSLRLDLYRKPDYFDHFLNIFMVSDLSNLRHNILSSINTSNEKIIVIDKQNSKWETDKFCPHQKAELSQAEITKDGFLICPKHGWRFDLNNDGKSTNGICKIYAKKIKEQ